MLKVKLVGQGPIDNAVIFLEDPKEKISHFLSPTSNDGTEWEKMDYSLYVQAFSGTQFECTLIKKMTRQLSFRGYRKNAFNVKKEKGT
jgi:hypothetical protein